ncbi:hypothetical protein PSAC2689_70314 [Paraburkholderia sacchari]
MRNGAASDVQSTSRAPEMTQFYDNGEGFQLLAIEYHIPLVGVLHAPDAYSATNASIHRRILPTTNSSWRRLL